ncbi:MAG: hypothetical protein ACI9YT_002714 [Halobacteriales archaeon]|jgi:hypothetical protein
MTNTVAGLLPQFAYLVTIAVSFPIAVVSFVLARRKLLEPVLTATLVAVALLVMASAGTLAAVVSVDDALEVVRIAAGAGVGLVALPLGAGTAFVRRTVGVDRDRALRATTATWPIGLLVSFLVYIAPGGPYRYNITALTGNEAIVAFVVWGACILLLPGVLGALVVRVGGW